MKKIFIFLGVCSIALLSIALASNPKIALAEEVGKTCSSTNACPDADPPNQDKVLNTDKDPIWGFLCCEAVMADRGCWDVTDPIPN